MKKLATTLAVAGAVLAIAPTAPVYAQEPIKIGVVTPLSGGYAGIGRTVRWGFELAAAEINDAGGINGRKLVLLFEDEEANPAVAVQKAERLLQVEKVDFLTGTVNSASTLAVGLLGERNNRLVSTTVSYADSITGDRCSPNVFRVNARAEQQSVALAAWLKKEKPQAKLFLVGPDYEMGRSTVAAFKRSAESLNIKSIGEIFAPLDSKDYSQYFGQIRSARPDVIYLSTAGNDTVRLLTQMQEFNMLRNVSVIGSAGTVTGQNITALGKAAEGYVTGIGYSPLIDTPENKKFVAAFRAKFQEDPDLFAADSYGMLYAYKAAAEKAGSIETDKLRDALRNLSWMTPQGQKTIRGGDHQAMSPMFIVRIENGQFKVVSTISAADAIGPDACTRF